MLSLVIHHNIHLTREQCYTLHEGKNVECIGVIVPVWVSGQFTSEPAKEVFCKYLILNNGEKTPIKLMPGGFELTLPARNPITPPQNFPLEEWRQLTEEEKEELGSFQVAGASSLNLLDGSEGGSGTLMYREHSKIRYEESNKVVIIHLVQIRRIDDLTETCCITPPLWADNPSTPMISEA